MPTLSYVNNMFIFKCAYSERHLPKDAGFAWSTEYKSWYTKRLVVAAKLRNFADRSAKTELGKVLVRKSPWLSPLPDPPDGLTLMSHQKEPILFALGQNRSYLGLDAGLGKTVVAAMIAVALDRRMVYVTPPYLRKNIEAEFEKWAPLFVMEGKLLLVSDTMLSRPETWDLIVQFLADKKGVIIVDEAHRFSNPDAQRTQGLLGVRTKPGIVDMFSRRIYMSGTPMQNRPMELFAILDKESPESIDFMTRFEYGRYFCNGHKNDFGHWDFSGAKNMQELGRRIMKQPEGFMLRMKKDRLDLPEKIREVFTISRDMSPALSKMNTMIEAAYGSIEDVIKAELAQSIGKTEDELHMATYRRLLGISKAPAVAEYVKTLLEETTESILLFVFHKEVMKVLTEALSGYRPLVIDGSIAAKDRFAIVEEFQTNKDHRIMLGNYKSMGVGFNITKADRVIMAEYSWNPADNSQAEDRAHRIGRTRSVLVQYCVYKNSLDKAVIETLLRKQRSIQHV